MGDRRSIVVVRDEKEFGSRMYIYATKKVSWVTLGWVVRGFTVLYNSTTWVTVLQHVRGKTRSGIERARANNNRDDDATNGGYGDD